MRCTSRPSVISRRAWRRPAALRLALLALPFGTLIASCALGPDYQRPAAPDASGYASKPMADVTASTQGPGGDAQLFVMGRDIPFAWWTAFKSPQLDALVEAALRSNPGIPAAQAALRQAHEYVLAQQGYFYPTVTAGFNAQREKLAGNQGGNSPGIQGNGTDISTYQNPSGPAPFNGPVYYNFYTAQLALSYVPDVFGTNRRQVESLQAQADTVRYQLEATYVTLTSNVVAAAIQGASLRSQIKATQDFIGHNAAALDILRDQRRFGYAMGIDVATQESLLAQAKAMLPPLLRQLEQTRDLIRALCGKLAPDAVDDEFDLSALALPQELPLSLPSRLIEQRPDVRAAEEQLHAASAQVGVAVANRLPQFTISAALGGAASRVTQMFGPGGPFWNFAADVLQPVFDGGTLLHRERAADAGLRQAQALYRSAVITAVQNVADTLHAVQSDADALVANAEAERAAKAALDITQRQCDLGYVSRLVLLQAQEMHEQAVLNLLLARTNRYGDSAALYQALGGGWWNRAAAATAGPVAANEPMTAAAKAQ